LKLNSGENLGRIRFYLFLGAVRHGPIDGDFSENAVLEVPFQADWHDQLEEGCDSLRLGLEFVNCE